MPPLTVKFKPREGPRIDQYDLACRTRRSRFTTASATFNRGSRLVQIELFAGYMTLKAKGLRTPFALPYDVALDFAMKRAMTQSAAEKRMARRKAKGLK